MHQSFVPFIGCFMFYPMGRPHCTSPFICLAPPLWVQEYAGQLFLRLVSMTGTRVSYLCCPCAGSGLSFHLTEVLYCDRSLTARTRHSGLREKTRSGPISQTFAAVCPDMPTLHLAHAAFQSGQLLKPSLFLSAHGLSSLQGSWRQTMTRDPFIFSSLGACSSQWRYCNL